MKVGVNLHNYGPFASKPAIDAIVERAEALGYDSIWTADHILVPRTEPEPFGQLLETLTTLSYVAAKTQRIALGTSILVLPQREPILVGKQAATIDHLSGGRLTLGVGVGWIEREFDYLGADFAARGNRADEYIAALRELWTAQEPQFAGDTVRFDEAIFSPRPRRQNGIPILVGGASTRALRRAACLADGWHALDASLKKIRAAAATLATFAPDRPVDISLRIRTAIGRAIRPPPTPEDPGHGALEGEPDAIAAAILRYRDAGVTHIVIDPDTNALEQYLDDLEGSPPKSVLWSLPRPEVELPSLRRTVTLESREQTGEWRDAECEAEVSDWGHAQQAGRRKLGGTPRRKTSATSSHPRKPPSSRSHREPRRGHSAT